MPPFWELSGARFGDFWRWIHQAPAPKRQVEPHLAPDSKNAPHLESAITLGVFVQTFSTANCGWWPASWAAVSEPGREDFISILKDLHRFSAGRPARRLHLKPTDQPGASFEAGRPAHSLHLKPAGQPTAFFF